MQIEPGEAFAPAEERQLDDEAGADDGGAEPFDESADRLNRAAGRKHVVVDDDARPLRTQVRMELEGVLAVLEDVARADRLRRQLAGPAGGDEAAADGFGDRRAEDEAARLGAENEVGLFVAHPGREIADRLSERFRV